MANDNIKEIAVIVAGIDEEYQYNIIRGINDFTSSHNINTSYFAAFGGMLSSKRFDAGEYSIYKLINYKLFDGAVLMTNTICDQEVKENIIKEIQSSGIPAVVFDCDDYPELYNIRIDNSAAMRDMVRHVIKEHGAKVLNYISGPMSNPEARERCRAFREVLAENGIQPDDDRIFYGEFRSHDGKQAIEEFLSSGLSMPDAFICANDAMALTAVSALEKAGYKVPDDVIVTGFDFTYNARNFSPALTSVKRPLFKMGQRACEVLMEVFEGNEPPKTISLNSQPVFTESCGCCSGNADDTRSYRKKTYSRIEKLNSGISLMNRLTAELAETEDINELVKALTNVIPDIGCEKFSLCLTDDWQDPASASDTFTDTAPYPGYITSPLIWDKGDIRSSGYFPSSHMFPERFEDSGNISYFLPLHFRERRLGYYIITNGDFPAYSLLCHTLTMNLSNSIENLRKLLHINKAMDQLNRLYVIDPLCNIYNRNGFINIADDRFKECINARKTVMLTFIDMDGLKYINDNYGHNEGDFAIQRLATVIQECCSPTGVCARFGGDEFVIFDSDVSPHDAEALKRTFNSKIDNMNLIIKKPYLLSASIGSIVVVAEPDMTLYSVIKEADERMYEVKKMKKNSRSHIAE